MPKENQENVQVSKDVALGSVKQALRPSNVDKVEVREALLGALRLGFDPAELYLRAVQARPKEWEEAPSLSAVLPANVFQYLDDLEEGILDAQARPEPEEEE